MYCVEIYHGMDRGWHCDVLADGTENWYSSLWKAKKRAHMLETYGNIMTRVIDINGKVVE